MTVLKGVGETARRELAELEIDTVLDLVTHYPRRYIDGTRLVPIADLAVGDKASVLGQVTRVSRPRRATGGAADGGRPGSWWGSPTTAAGSTWCSSTRPGGPSSWPSAPWPCSTGRSAPTAAPSS